MVSLPSRFALAALAVFAPGIAAGADLPAQPSTSPAAATFTPAVPDWIVTVGIEGRILPAWPGASDNKFGLTALPLFGVRKAGTPPDFNGPRDSFSFSIINIGTLKLGPAIALIGDRNARNYKELYGLGSVGYAAQIGAFAEYWPVPWLRLRGEVRQGIGGETGVTGNAFLDAVVPVDQWTFSAGPRLTVQSAAATSPYFSITPAQSAATATVASTTGLAPLPAYNAEGGLYSYGAGTQVLYRFDPQWEAHTFIEYERLTGSAADSPLVTQRGSPNQFTYGIGATYSFSMHPWW
jgi:outer membrane protein